MNKKFNWDDYETAPEASSKFNWDDYEAEETDVSYLETLARGGAQGASFGFADEITAGLESAFTDKTYKQALAESRANYKAAEEANPGTYMAGDIGGSIATGLIPGLGAVKGATTAARLGKAAASMGAQGAVSGLGRSEAEDIGGLAADTALGGVVGAGFGAAGQGLGEAVSKVAPKVQNYMKSKAEDFAVDSLRPNLRQSADINRADASKVGRALLDNDVIKPFASKEAINERLMGSIEKHSGRRGDALEYLDEAAKFAKEGDIGGENALIEPSQVQKLRDEIVAKHAGSNSPAYVKAREELERYVAAFDQPKSLRETLIEIQGLDSDLHNQYGMDSSIAKDYLKEFRHNLDGLLTSKADELAQPMKAPADLTLPDDLQKMLNETNEAHQMMGAEYKDAKQNLSKLMAARKASERAKNAEMANNTIPLTAMITGTGALGGGIATGDPMEGLKYGALAGGLRWGQQKYGAQIAATVLNKLSKTLQSEPGRLGKFAKPLMEAAKKGNKSLAATDFVLSQLDPEYREMKKQLDGEDEQD